MVAPDGGSGDVVSIDDEDDHVDRYRDEVGPRAIEDASADDADAGPTSGSARLVENNLLGDENEWARQE
jgi:hypothetical protein